MYVVSGSASTGEDEKTDAEAHDLLLPRKYFSIMKLKMTPSCSDLLPANADEGHQAVLNQNRFVQHQVASFPTGLGLLLDQ